ncbi:MAG: phospholipase D family protein [Roseibacillus sp.]|nr:phospholipase D family protein [Roseibacillus sp.]
MLDCRSDRLDYGKLLCPPPGHTLDHAVAATYSADLQTLLSIPVALVYAQTLEGDLSEARIQLLEAIKEFSKKVLIYHQKGQLHVPPTANWLYAFMEDALVPILPDDAFTAFHPKIWLIRYRAKDDSAPPLYRLIVLSRNLTFDRSWDVASSFDGTVGTNAKKENQPLIDFFRWLETHRPIPRSSELFEELSRVTFDLPEKFTKLLFHPIGIPNYRKNPVEHQKADRAVAISRFLHPKALQTLASNTAKQLHVLSEKTDLERIPLSIRQQFRSYRLNDLIIDGESLDLAEDGESEIQRQHLHAKLFIFRTVDQDSRWFLGSANATEAAFRKNVEFMVELHSGAYSARPSRVLKSLIEEDGTGAFVEFHPEAEENDSKADEQRTTLRRFEHALLNARMEARLEPGSQRGTYDLLFEITAPEFPQLGDISVTVKPFNIDTAAQALTSADSTELRFSRISEVYLSRFLHFSIKGKDLPTRQFLICVPMKGLPRGRLDNIFRRMIDSQDKFFQYLRFLLGDEISKEELLRIPGVNSGSTSSEATSFFDAPLYEQLLVASSRAPSKLRAVDEVISKLHSEESDVVPTEFLEFWSAFRPLIPKLEPTNDE